MRLFKKILVTLLATAFKVAAGVLGLLKPMASPFAAGGRWLGRTLFSASLPVFRIAVTVKRTLKKLAAPLEQRNRILQLFTRRYFFHLTFVGLALTVVTANLNAYEVKRDELTYANIFTSLALGDEYGDIEEVRPPAAPTVRRSAEQGVIGPNALFGTDDDLDSAPGTTAGGSAVVKPFELVAGEAAATAGGPRLGVVTYTVQEGDTISGVAVRFGITGNTILWENNLTPYAIIRPGQQLTILPISGLRHQVARGETLGKIAAKYKVDADAIVAANKLASADDLNPGELLIIPGGQKPRPTPTYALRRPPPSPVSASTGRMLWPATCRRITQYFGWRHTGIDIACASGTPVYAAEAGRVIKAQGGWNGGYGIMVVLQHAGGAQTLYGHNSRLYVRVGEEVAKGQTIAAIGNTGRSSGPHVHFEVRVGGYRKNPLSYLR